MKTLFRTAMIAIVVFFIALANVALGQKSESQKWLPLSSNNETAIKVYHDALIRSGHNDEAAFKAKLDEAIKIDPKLYMALVCKAWINREEIPSVLALPIENLTKAELLMRDALTELKNGTKNFLPIAMSVTKEYENTIEAYFYADYMMFEGNDWNKVGFFSKKMIELDPEFPIGYHWLGYSYLIGNNLKMAWQMFEKYAQLAPNEGKPYDALGEYYLNICEFEKAAHNFDKAVSLGRDNAKKNAEKSRMLAKGLKFSSEQKEVWQAVESFWKYPNEENIEAFKASIHDDYIGWNTKLVVPINKKDFISYFPYYKSKSYSIKPVQVAVSGNNAVVSYASDVDYGPVKYHGKHVDFYIKENGKWLLLGDNCCVEQIKEEQIPDI